MGPRRIRVNRLAAKAADANQGGLAYLSGFEWCLAIVRMSDDQASTDEWTLLA